MSLATSIVINNNNNNNNIIIIIIIINTILIHINWFKTCALEPCTINALTNYDGSVENNIKYLK